MNAYAKLIRASELLQTHLKSHLKQIEIDDDLIHLKITLKSNIRIYINYNNYDQYSYVIFYSPDPMDRIIIDNYDEDWKVGSSPNHIHQRFKKEGEVSKFGGDPENDMKLLIDLI